MNLEQHNNFDASQLKIGGRVTFAEINSDPSPKSFKAEILNIKGESVSVKILDCQEKSPPGSGIPMATLGYDGEEITIHSSAIIAYMR